MRISEVSARSGVPPTALRYYEAQGLIAAQRESNGYRAFDHTVFERLDFIAAAKQLNLALPEIRDLIFTSEVESCTKVKAALEPLLARQLQDLEVALTSVARRRDQLLTASEHVAACPDKDERCRSECAFAALIPHSYRTADSPDVLAELAAEWHSLFPDAITTKTLHSIDIQLHRGQLDEIIETATSQQERDPQLVVTIELRGQRVSASVALASPRWKPRNPLAKSSADNEGIGQVDERSWRASAAAASRGATPFPSVAVVVRA